MKFAFNRLIKIPRGKYFLLILLSLISLSPLTISQNIEPRFEHISIKDGLPENSVKVVYQDRYGFMWFGTQNGLVKYDGYQMVVYQPETNNPKSISHAGPNIICEDHLGLLWIGTSGLEGFGGLNSFDTNTEKFTRYMHNPIDKNSISSNAVYSIAEDSFGRIWVGTDNGLNLLDRKTKNLERFYLIDSLSLPGPFSNQSNTRERHIRIYSVIVDTIT